MMMMMVVVVLAMVMRNFHLSIQTDVYAVNCISLVSYEHLFNHDNSLFRSL